MQEIIVYLILTIVAVVLIHNIYRQAKGRNHSCSCDSCPMHNGECHCDDAIK